MLYCGEDNLPILPTGKICHETMHALGPKDLYRADQTSAVYYMSLMGKHLSPVGQYISVKERESLGWLDTKQIGIIEKNGRYKIFPASFGDGIVCYKYDLPNGKTLYIEYRQFDEKGNRYDSKDKILYSCNTGNLIKGVTLKSGLVCYLANTGVRFPSNLNTSGAKWNMEVVSDGKYSTMSDCAVKEGEELYIGSGISVKAVKMTDSELEFEINGAGQNKQQFNCDIKDGNLIVRTDGSDGIFLVSEFDDSNVFLQCGSYLPQETVKIHLLPSTNNVKVMWWDSLGKPFPLSNEKTIER